MILSTENIVNRINDVITRSGRRLCQCREGSRFYDQLGDFFVVDRKNQLELTDVNLVDLARQVGVYYEN